MYNRMYKIFFYLKSTIHMIFFIMPCYGRGKISEITYISKWVGFEIFSIKIFGFLVFNNFLIPIFEIIVSLELE